MWEFVILAEEAFGSFGLVYVVILYLSFVFGLGCFGGFYHYSARGFSVDIYEFLVALYQTL